MKVSDAQKLRIGIYKVFWKNYGGTSIAAVGQMRGGGMWIAPLNWLSPPTDSNKAWRLIEKVEPLGVHNL